MIMTDATAKLQVVIYDMYALEYRTVTFVYKKSKDVGMAYKVQDQRDATCPQ